MNWELIDCFSFALDTVHIMMMDVDWSCMSNCSNILISPMAQLPHEDLPTRTNLINII